MQNDLEYMSHRMLRVSILYLVGVMISAFTRDCGVDFVVAVEALVASQTFIVVTL